MKSIKCVCALCGKEIERKKQSVYVEKHFCSMKCKAEYQRMAKPVTKEWLIEHYVVKRMNTTEIGKIVNRNPKSVWNWLKDFEIPTRPRGGKSSPGSFKKGNISPTSGTHRPEYIKEILRKARKDKPNLPHLCGGKHWLDGKLPEDHPNWNGGCTPERQVFYSSKQWKEIIPKVWHRDNATCQLCGMMKKANRGVQFDIHHIVSFSNKSKRASLSNLVLLCRPCHLWVHSSKNNEGVLIHDDTKASNRK